jgi:hypothetical protein
MRLSHRPAAPQPSADLDIQAGEGFALQAQTFGGPLLRGWTWASQPFREMFRAGSFRRWFGMLLAGTWTIAVWALFGGAIARIAALYLAHGETIGPIAALKSAAFRWPSTAGAPTFALIALFMVALPLMIAGLVVRLDFLAIVLALVWFLLIVIGLAVAIVGIGLAFGWPLMASTVAVERTDAFGGISRGYAYVYQRPLHLVFYIAVAGLLGLLAQAAVNLIVDSTYNATKWAVSTGAGAERTAELYRDYLVDDDSVGQPELRAARIIRFWNHGIATIAASFPMAYLWPAAVGIYLLMRRHVDSTDLGEITFDEGDPERGMPTLIPNPATGVPRVAEPATPAAATNPPGAPSLPAS